MAKMVKNCWTNLEWIGIRCPEWLKMAKMAKIAVKSLNGWKWLGMAGNV